jgi:glyoxylase-like metal-dependent hydrolase (beta-lactamase superfamily II)
MNTRGTANGLVCRLAFVALLVAGATAWPAAQQPASGGGDLEVVQVQPDFYMLAGDGGNIALQIGPDGVLMVDTGTAAKADAVLAAIKKLTPKSIRYIVNTSADADHVGGNEKISAAGEPVHQTGALFGAFSVDRAPILAEEHVLSRMSAPTGKQPPFPVNAWPTMTYSAAAREDQRYIYFNGQAVQVSYQPSAHTDGDSIVFFRRNDIVVLGDLLDTTKFPMIDVDHGGSVQGVIDALNRVIRIAVPPTPMTWQEGGTIIIPGHGRVCVPSDVVMFRDMVTVIRDRVQDGIKRGLALADVQKENPTQGWRRRYGSDSGPWTTANFVEAVYKSLKAAKPQQRAGH